jgi:hypothetical protein
MLRRPSTHPSHSSARGEPDVIRLLRAQDFIGLRRWLAVLATEGGGEKGDGEGEAMVVHGLTVLELLFPIPKATEKWLCTLQELHLRNN